MSGCRRRRVLAMVLTGAVLAGACTQGGQGRVAVHHDAREDRASDAARILLGLLNPPQGLLRAEQIGIARCVQHEGLHYPLRSAAGDPLLPRTLAGRPMEIEAARQDGYGFWTPMGQDGHQNGGSSPRLRETMEPAGAPRIRVRLPGGYIVSAARVGCVARARTATYGSVRNYLLLFYLPQVIRLRLLEHFDEALGTVEVQRAAAVYAACMRSSGYSVQNPGDAWRAARRQFRVDRRTVSAAQRRMAVADATCQSRSRIYEAISQGMVEKGRGVLLRFRVQIQMMKAVQRAALMRAAAIVRAGLLAQEDLW